MGQVLLSFIVIEKSDWYSVSDKIGINTLVFFKSDCVLKIKKSFFVNYKLISIFVPVNIQLMPTNPKYISAYIFSKMGVIVERERERERERNNS